MRCLVTGGAGFIGCNLVFELQKLGHEVAVLDRMSTASHDFSREFNGQIYAADIAEPLTVSERYDVIFHQAAITDPRHSDDNETYQKNVAGFQQVIEFAQAWNARLVYASTAGLYGHGPTPMREDQPKECLTAYGRSKLKMDEMAEPLFQKMPIIGLRYFNVFGPREAHKGRPASMVLHLYRQMKEGKRPRIFQWGEHKRDFIYVKDAVTANLKALTAPSGVYNVGTGIASSFNDLIAVLNRAMETSLPPEYFEMPFESTTYQADTQADTTKAERKLGFKAEWPLEAAVKDYVRWLSFN